MKHLLFAALAVVVLLAAYLALRPRVERAGPAAPAIIEAAHAGLGRIFRSGYAYRQAGVMLMEIAPAGAVQRSLFAEGDTEEHQALMDAVDVINQRYGSGSVFFGATGTKRTWSMRQVRRSPRYTTRWDELLSVSAR